MLQKNLHAEIRLVQPHFRIKPDTTSPRRLLELRLLHHFTAVASKSLPGADTPCVESAWTIDTPLLALEHESLLYAILAYSALHLSTCSPTRALEYRAAYHYYHSATLVAHNKAISVLSPANADAVCLTCVLVNVLSFYWEQGSVNAVEATEYSPNQFSGVVRQLHMSYGAGEVLRQTWMWIDADPGSVAAVLMKASPQFREAEKGLLVLDETSKRLVIPCSRISSHLSALLDPCYPPAQLGEPEESEPWDTDTEDAYKEALASLSYLYEGIAAGEPACTVVRRVMGFGSTISKHFIMLAEQARPRALVILALFFSRTRSIPQIWWVEGSRLRAENRIREMLDSKWQRVLELMLAQ